jgi:hypothetical protein
LSDFILANSQKDEATSDALLQELKNNGALSRRNLMLLELQQAGKLEKWDTLLNHDSLADLVRGRIPTTLMRMLLKAYQQRFLHPTSTGIRRPPRRIFARNVWRYTLCLRRCLFYPRMRLTLRRGKPGPPA